MKTKILLKMGLIAMCFMAGFVEMEAQELFQKEYGYGNRNDRVRQQFPSTIIQTRDSGFVAINVGTEVFGLHPDKPVGMIVKTDKNGDVQWSKYLNTIAEFELVYPNSVIQAHDGNFYICGRLTENMQFKVFLLKLDKDGNKLWIKTYSASPERSMIFRTLAETSENHLLLIGSGLLFKMDSSGNCVWAKQHNSNFNVIKKVTDTTFVLAGSSLALIDNEGNILWAKNYFESGGVYVQPLKNGGYAFVTSRGSVVSKVDNSGNILWSKVYKYNQLNPAVIDELSSGDIIVAGTYGTPSEGQYGWMSILDSLGNLRNAKVIPKSEGNIYSGTAMFDGNFIVESSYATPGASYFSSSLLKIGSNGNTSCPKNERIFNLTNEDYTPTVTIPQITDSLIQITASDLLCEFLAVDITATDICAPTDVLEESQPGDFQLYPNPASGVCTILLKEDIQNADISIIDMHGKTLHRKFLKNAEGEIKLDISPLQPGAYFVKVIADGREFMQKMIVE